MGNNPISGFDADGRDVILLSAPQGAAGFGHAALLVGNNDTGWTYISKDGTKGFFGTYGKPNESTIRASKSPIFPTLQSFLNSKFNQDAEHQGKSEYHFGLYIYTSEEADKNIIASAKSGAMENYHVITNNCVQNCVRPLVEQGLLPRIFSEMYAPNDTFDMVKGYFKANKGLDYEFFNGFYPSDVFQLFQERLPEGKIEVGPLSPGLIIK